MKIELDLGYDDAFELREWLRKWKAGITLSLTLSSLAVADALMIAMENEDERRGEAHMQRLMESGGVDDSKYRQDMKDAGRGHLLR